MLVRDDSILRNIPATLNRKQALFLDGMRHAAEICDFSYRRLQHTLTEIAVVVDHPKELATSAFVDAWAIVDALDRFRMLWKLQPNATFIKPIFPQRTIDQEFADVRNVRNVSDHLAQRADQIVSLNGSALGELSWITVIDAQKQECASCVLVPGVAKNGTYEYPVPRGETIGVPTGFIQLRAGETVANLSTAISCLAARVKQVEEYIRPAIQRDVGDMTSNGIDMLVRATLKPN